MPQKLLIALALTLALLNASAIGQSPDAPPAVGDAGSSSVRMNNNEIVYTLALCRGLMARYSSVEALRTARNRTMLAVALEEQIAELGLAAPAGLYERKSHPTIIYLTVYATKGSKLTVEGRANTVQAALLDALSGLMISEHWKTLGFAENLDKVRIACDLVWGLEPYIVNMAEPFLYTFTPGLDGLIYENGSSRSVLLPWEAVRQPWSVLYVGYEGERQTQEQRAVYTQHELKQAVFGGLLQRASMTMGTYQTPAARILRFRTQSFIDGAAGGTGQPLTLFRVGPVVYMEELSEKLVSAGLDSAVDYLARVPERSGIVRAGYDPLRLSWAPQNGMRPDQQAITLQALASLYKLRKQDWMLQGSKLLLETLASGIQGLRVQGLDKVSRQTAFASYDGRSEASWHALMLLAVARLQEVAPNDAQKSLIEHLANTLLSVQKDDGTFMLFIGPGTDEGLMKNDRQDAHGASLNLLALVRAYEVLKNDELRRRARLTADYLVFQREKTGMGRTENEGLADPYAIEALDALDRHESNDAYVAYAALCARTLLEMQAAGPMRYPRDEWGGFGEGSVVDTQYTAFCLRGLDAAVRMAGRIRATSAERYEKLELKPVEHAARIAGERAIAYLLGMQYNAGNSFYVEKSEAALGGFRHSTTDSRISTVTVATWILSQVERQLAK